MWGINDANNISLSSFTVPLAGPLGHTLTWLPPRIERAASELCPADVCRTPWAGPRDSRWVDPGVPGYVASTDWRPSSLVLPSPRGYPLAPDAPSLWTRPMWSLRTAQPTPRATPCRTSALQHKYQISSLCVVMLTYQSTAVIEQSPSWAPNICSGVKTFPAVLCNPKNKNKNAFFANLKRWIPWGSPVGRLRIDFSPARDTYRSQDCIVYCWLNLHVVK